MISLFSRFDLKFYMPFLFILLVFFNFFDFIYKISISSKTLNFIPIFFMNFFCSLKSKRFNEFFLKFFILIFFFLFFLNLRGIFPYSIAITSQIRIVLFIRLIIWSCFAIFQFYQNIMYFISHCIPEGSPRGLAVILFLIEIVRFSIRPLTLAVRLTANILAGHLLIILLASLVFYFNPPFVFYILLNLVEIFVRLIQAYIFVTLITLYYADIS